MYVLHITSRTDEPASLAIEVKMKELAGSAAGQYIMCPQGSETEIFCFNKDIISFPWNSGWFSILDNSALLSRICKNYKISVIYIYDEKAVKMVKRASRLYKRLKTVEMLPAL